MHYIIILLSTSLLLAIHIANFVLYQHAAFIIKLIGTYERKDKVLIHIIKISNYLNN